MRRRPALTLPDTLTVLALIVAAVGVTAQILSGAPYPTVPLAYFILLIPAVVIRVSRAWWAPIPAVVGGLFLTFGLFAAGQAHRLTSGTSIGDALGLWMQAVAVVVAVVAGSAATRSRLRLGGVERG